METELISLDLSESKREKCIRAYITKHMSDATLHQYISVLFETDSVSKATEAAVFNEYVNIAISTKLGI